jgi:hypothetical protein
MAGHQHESSNVRDNGTSKLDLNLYELKILQHNENSNLNNLSEQGVSVTSVSSNNLDKPSSVTSVNDCGVNTLPVNSTNTIKKPQNVTTKIPSQANQSTIKMPYQLNGLAPLTVYHQNVRGLGGTANELLSQFYPTLPRILRLSEHHTNQLELQQTFLDSYKLGTGYCRTLYEKGGVSIFVNESLTFVSIDLKKYCKNKDLEVCDI